jgi:hypothetical protein
LSRFALIVSGNSLPGRLQQKRVLTLTPSNYTRLNSGRRRSARGGLKVLDFNSIHDFSNFTQDETIEFFKVLRICIIELDTHVSSLLNLSEVIKRLGQKEFAAKKVRINADIVKQRTTKIIAIAKRPFGASLSDAQVLPYVKTIGVY